MHHYCKMKSEYIICMNRRNHTDVTMGEWIIRTCGHWAHAVHGRLQNLPLLVGNTHADALWCQVALLAVNCSEVQPGGMSALHDIDNAHLDHNILYRGPRMIKYTNTTWESFTKIDVAGKITKQQRKGQTNPKLCGSANVLVSPFNSNGSLATYWLAWSTTENTRSISAESGNSSPSNRNWVFTWKLGRHNRITMW